MSMSRSLSMSMSMSMSRPMSKSTAINVNGNNSIQIKKHTNVFTDVQMTQLLYHCHVYTSRGTNKDLTMYSYRHISTYISPELAQSIPMSIS